VKAQPKSSLVRNAKRRMYYAEHRESEQSKHLEWLAKNAERVRAADRVWRAENPDRVRSSKRAHYVRHRETIRKKHREYYQLNREKLNAHAARRYWGDRDPILDRKRPGPARRQPAPPFGYVTESELQVCVVDPRKTWTICGPKVIVCLECGGKFSSLSQHLRWHHLTASSYKAKLSSDDATPRLNVTSSLMCLALQQRRRRLSKKISLGRWKKGDVNGPKVRNRVRQGTIQSRLNQSEGMRRALNSSRARSKSKSTDVSRPPQKRSAGRPSGMTPERIKEAKQLEEAMDKFGRVRGSLRKAAKVVYRGIAADLGYDRARQTIKDFRSRDAKNREKN
jgi:predicted transcriptional regulator